MKYMPRSTPTSTDIGIKMISVPLLLALFTLGAADPYQPPSSNDIATSSYTDSMFTDVLEHLKNSAHSKFTESPSALPYIVQEFCSSCLLQVQSCAYVSSCLLIQKQHCIPCPSPFPNMECDPSCENTDNYKTSDDLYEGNQAPTASVDKCLQGCSNVEDRVGCFYLCVAHPDTFSAIQDAASNNEDILLDNDETKSTVEEDEKRGFPVFSGKRGFPVFSGKRGFPVFSGKRGFPVFSGKRGFPVFSGKRGFPVFSGKRGFPVFSGKRGFPVFSGKRGFPVLSGKRGFPVFSGKRVFPVFSEKRGFPVFSGKRGFPVFSGKRGFPVFSGKRGFPVFSGKRGFPVFSGKRGFPVFSGKRGFPVFSGKRGFPVFSGKRGFPVFSGKRGFPVFSGKRGFPIFSATRRRESPLFVNENDMDTPKRGFPVFQKGKRSLDNEDDLQNQFSSNEFRETPVNNHSYQNVVHGQGTSDESPDGSEIADTLKRGFPISQLVLQHRDISARWGHQNAETPTPNPSKSTVNQECLGICKATSYSYFWSRDRIDCSRICSEDESVQYDS